MLSNKELSAVSEKDIQELIDLEVQEGPRLEYKRELGSIKASKEIKEFLADLSSFANSGGGEILYGVEAVDGIPKKIVPLVDFSPDEDLRRLESLSAAHLDPVIFGLQWQEIKLETGGFVAVVRVPASLVAPHMITFEDNGRFYIRESKGKRLMTVPELRSAFGFGYQQTKEVRNFRVQRIADLLTGQSHIPFFSQPAMLVHVVPVESLRTAKDVDLEKLYHNTNYLRPEKAQSWGPSFNFDGIAGVEMDRQDNLAHAYFQVFRNGMIEILRTIHGPPVENKYLGSWAEGRSALMVNQALATLRFLNVTGPVFVMISFLRIKDFCFVRGPNFHTEVQKYPRDELLLPEQLLTDLTADAEQSLLPTFNILWQTFGYSRSFGHPG